MPPRRATGGEALFLSLLTANDIVKRFGGVTALAGVDLELNRGEVLGLIGPNGSGKTTLVNCISGVLEIDEGEIALGGRRLTRAARVRRARFGLARTFQNPRLFVDLTVRENVAVGLNALGRRSRGGRERVSGLLKRLRLSDYSRTLVSDLPYGYQRRVEIARALAGRPSVLLLDEPAAGLNDVETAELRDLLHELRHDDEISIIVIDHDMSLIMGVSDRIQVLDEGQVIFMGAPADAFKQRHVVEAYLGTQ
jgi:ABC-type branched-subunit amino acid transport system ATPase component